MKHFTVPQRKQLNQLASQMRKGVISFQEYHNRLTKYYE